LPKIPIGFKAGGDKFKKTKKVKERMCGMSKTGFIFFSQLNERDNETL